MMTYFKDGIKFGTWCENRTESAAEEFLKDLLVRKNVCFSLQLLPVDSGGADSAEPAWSWGWKWDEWVHKAAGKQWPDA